MKYLLLGLLLFSSYLNAQTVAIDELQWTLEKEKAGARIYSTQVPGSPHRAFLLETVIDADIASLVDILRTPGLCSQWVYRCESSRVYQATGYPSRDNVDFIYTSTQMPFPVKDRDILAEVTWDRDPITGVVTGYGRATRNIMPTTHDKIRIENATMIWELTPLRNGKSKVRSYAHADLAGSVPVWILNLLSVKVPLKTINGLKQIIAKREHSHGGVPMLSLR